MTTSSPKPIALTQIDEGDHTDPREPQAFVVVGEIPGLAALEARIVALETAAP